MAGRITKGPNSPDLNDLQYAAFVTATDGSPAIAVTNTDGSAISGGGGAVTVANGADVAEGSTTDAAVTAGSAGSVSGKLRQISADVSAVVANQTNGIQQVQGNIASGATDSGNPQKIGGVQRTTQPTLADGQRGDLQMDTKANAKVTMMANGTQTAITAIATNADGVAVSAVGSHLEIVNRATLFNGTAFDRQVSVAGANIATPTGVAAQAPLATAVTPSFSNYSNTGLTNTIVTPKASAGRVYDVHVDNPNAAAWVYVQFFDASAPTLGTTAPTFVLGVPPNGSLDKSVTFPYVFATQIKLAATTTATGSTAPASALNITLGYA